MRGFERWREGVGGAEEDEEVGACRRRSEEA